MHVEPFVESQGDLQSPERLQQRLSDEGYLFFRNLLDPEPLLEVRREFLQICQNHGWLLEGTDPNEGKGRADAYSGYFEFTEVYRDIQRLERFHALPHHPGILDTLARALGEKVFPHPRNIARITLPGSINVTTPSHQDYVFIQGSTEFYTVWFPLSDCPRKLGGLMVARGSHKDGIYPTKEAEGTGGLCTDIDDDALSWHASDFRLGDVIMFHSLTIHKAFPNVTADLLRLSCDFRYQPFSEPRVVWNTLRPHMQLHCWKDIYAGWKDDRFKYYWQQYTLHVEPEVQPAEVQATVPR